MTQCSGAAAGVLDGDCGFSPSITAAVVLGQHQPFRSFGGIARVAEIADTRELAVLPAQEREISGWPRRSAAAAHLHHKSKSARAIAYNSAKAALISITQCLAGDLAARGVLVNAVAPGFVDTRMSKLPDGSSEYDTELFREVYIKHRKIPLGRPAQPDDIAGPVAFLCSDDAGYVTGQVLVVDGGLLATF